MYLIDTDGNVANQFAPGNPQTGQQSTPVSPDWLNMLQAELKGILDDAGIAPVKGTNGQVAAAITELLANVAATAAAQAVAAQVAAQASSLQKASNLADLASLVTAWTNLGVGITTNANGSYIKIGPLMVMWGYAIGNSASPRNLPASFSDYTKAQIVTGNADAQGANNDVVYAALLSNSTFNYGSKQTNGGNAESGYGGGWIAIGPA